MALLRLPDLWRQRSSKGRVRSSHLLALPGTGIRAHAYAGVSAEMSTNLLWTFVAGISAMREARPEDGLHYFIVESEPGSWTACKSSGLHYKVIVTLSPMAESKKDAMGRCEHDFAPE